MFLLHLSLLLAAQALVCVNFGSIEMLSLKLVSEVAYWRCLWWCFTEMILTSLKISTWHVDAALGQAAI